MQQIVYPNQVRFAIQALTMLADELEAADIPEWFALASAAMCLESLLRGEAPSDIAEVSACLKKLGVTNPGARLCGRTMYAAVSVASNLIDDHRLGLLAIQREPQQTARREVMA